MKKQIKSLSSIAVVTGLCIAFSFSADAQNWLTAGNTLSGTTPPTPTQFLGSLNGYNLLFKTNNVLRMTLLSSNGYLGIGTTTTAPVSLLANTSTAFTGGSATDALNWRTAQNNYAAVIVGAPSTGLGYGLRLHTNGTALGDIPLAVSSGTGAGTVNFVVTGTGNVGIGTTTPGAKLQISGGDLLLQSASGYPILWSKNSAGTISTRLDFNSIITAGDNMYLRTSSSGKHIILNDVAGNVGIGTTTPNSKLVVQGGDLNVTSGLGRFQGWFNAGTGTGPAAEVGFSGGQAYLIGYDRTAPGAYQPVQINGSSIKITRGASSTADLMVGTDGKIGMGISTPSAQLEITPGYIQGAPNGLSNLLRLGYLATGSRAFNFYQKVSPSTTGIEQFLFMNGELDPTSTFGNPMIYSAYTGGTAFYTDDAGLKIITTHGQYTQAPIYALSILSTNGNVLIGKTSQSNNNYKLDVGGSVRANEIVVNTTGADFVFEDNYQLKKLEEVEAFVKQNKHLPEIAPANDMQNNGQGIGEMNTKLLQKVEEITLYMIEMNKQIQNLKAENAELKASVKK